MAGIAEGTINFVLMIDEPPATGKHSPMKLQIIWSINIAQRGYGTIIVVQCSESGRGLDLANA